MQEPSDSTLLARFIAPKKCLENRVVHVACERMVSFLAQVSHVQLYDKRQKEKNEPT